MIHNLSGVIFETLCACLGLLADSNEASETIIPAYQEPEAWQMRMDEADLAEEKALRNSEALS